MKIGIVLHPYDEEKPSGLGRFVWELAFEMVRQGSEHEFLVFLKREPQRPLMLPGSNWKIIFGKGDGPFWIDVLLKHNEKTDIYLFNTPTLPLWWRPQHAVAIALDFAYWKLPAHSLSQWLKNRFLFFYHARSLERATHVVATSQATKNDCSRLFGVPESKVTVVHPGFTRICNITPKTVPVPAQYFFYLGAIKERKNTLNLVKAFVCFKKKTGMPHKLLIAGNNSGAYYDTILAHLKEAGMEKEVCFLGYLTDEGASFVYRNATAFVFVTLIEGSFGMPVLEAMDCGVPVVTSDTETAALLKETESALLVDPYDSEDIAWGLERVTTDVQLRKKLKKNGKTFSNTISWERTASEILALLERV